MTLKSDTAALVIPAPEHPTLPVRNTTARFPVRRIYCVGRNYPAHAVEMGHDAHKDPPFFFQKSRDNLLSDGKNFPYPPMTACLHHEVELVVALASGGQDISTTKAQNLVFGYAVGLDMTRRDIQAALKKASRPWEAAKAFEWSAPCSEIVPSTQIGHPAEGAIWLKVNDELRQHGDLNQMTWDVAEVIAELSHLFELAPGDLIMTGTPSGVAPVLPGDKLHAHIDRIGSLRTMVTL